MANQIKKKYIQDGAVDGEKLKLVKDQSVRGENQSGQEVDLLKLDQDDKVLLKGEEAALKSQVDAEQQRAEGEESRIEDKLDTEISDRQSEITRVEGLVSAEEVRAMAEELRLAGLISDEEQDRITGDSDLDAKIETEKSRIDAILAASEADKDSFAEIVSLINSVDTENDQAFAGYVASNDAALAQEVSDRQDADSNLQGQITQEISDRQAADTSIQSQITSLQGAGDVLFEDDASVYADAKAAIEDPTGRDGWYYKSSGSDKVNWYFHDGQTNPVTVSEFNRLYTVATVDSSSNDTFHLAYYTFPLGDGQDAGSWYRSRIVYVPSGNFARGVKTLFYMGQEPDASVYPDLPRVQMTVTSVAGSSVGLNEDTETIFTSVFSTNSGADAGTVELLVNKLGFNSSVYNKEYSLEIRGEFTLAGIKQSLLEEAIARENADIELQENIDVEKARIDAILDASEADKDSFAEIVSLINSVDTENDQAFAGYVASNDAALDDEVSAREAADASLQSQIDDINADVSAVVQFDKESFTVSQADLDAGYIDLAAEAKSSSIVMFVDRLAMHEGAVGDVCDYSVSVVGGVTRITFESEMVTPATEALEVGQVIRVTYAK